MQPKHRAGLRSDSDAGFSDRHAASLLDEAGHQEAPDPPRGLPREPGERLGLGFFSLVIGAFLGTGALALMLAEIPRLDWVSQVLLFVSEELLLAGWIVCLLCLIWAVGTPAWLETLYWHARRHLVWAILVSVAAVTLLLTLISLGYRVGEGLPR